eukprot:TRINITY_DN16006_c0_g1_i5.p1 TRINITY_DN16006_c0_g1~~TRINITY_DN16006_c0_g1_i5.p1  ORF type:complete len:195 (-),score=31.85 TRINITY_DN16006_c0_g1_i5:270-854(-)
MRGRSVRIHAGRAPMRSGGCHDRCARHGRYRGGSNSGDAGKRVIELGCGHGLPGILALKAGAQVDFCDFNEEVLVGLTIPNVLENSKAVAISARFFSGDWGSLPEVLGGCKYDLILTSDTLYSPESLKSLGAVLGQLLAPGGVALVAAKSYYFGVGGGTDMFVDWVHTNTKLKVEVAKTYQDGATNVREMLRVS